MPEVTAARGVGAGAGERTRDREETLTRDREETEIRPADQAGACVASDADGQAQTQPQPSDRIAPLRTFEEFNDQRKAAFLKVKDFKQADGRLVGYLCSSTPLEMIDAAGASAERLAEYEAGDRRVDAGGHACPGLGRRGAALPHGRALRQRVRGGPAGRGAWLAGRDVRRGPLCRGPRRDAHGGRAWVGCWVRRIPWLLVAIGYRMPWLLVAPAALAAGCHWLRERAL